MMEDKYKTDDFLSRWAAGTLSEAELMAFEKTKDYPLYQAILQGTDRFEIDTVDKDKVFDGIQQKLDAQSGRLKTLVPRWAYAIAASIALIMGYMLFFPSSTNMATGHGEQHIVSLPDNSEVILNAMSELRYVKSDWKAGKREVFLKGEGFFKVKRGSDFTVAIDGGTVAVLGTQFIVDVNPGNVEVICFEGKVRADIGEQSAIVKKGEAIRHINNGFENWILTDQQPTWLNGESSFKNAPIHQVIMALQDQYDITINSQSIDVNLRFTGSFTHTNLNTALRGVFDSMQITFTFTDEQTLDLTKK